LHQTDAALTPYIAAALRFLNEVGRSGVEGLPGQRDITVSGYYQNGQPGIAVFDLSEQSDTVHAGHTDVGDEQVTVVGTQILETIAAIGEISDPVASTLKRSAYCLAEVEVVVHEDYTGVWRFLLFRHKSRAQSILAPYYTAHLIRRLLWTLRICSL
jgi:hypothetical protein